MNSLRSQNDDGGAGGGGGIDIGKNLRLPPLSSDDCLQIIGESIPVRKTLSELSFVNRSRSTFMDSPKNAAANRCSLLSKYYSLDELPLAADLEK